MRAMQGRKDLPRLNPAATASDANRNDNRSEIVDALAGVADNLVSYIVAHS